ncbi:hypothetical protein [Rothia halotolerans]|uniref:hypothetical protein n=1 Tax=Rothia halotolerans TaxID=405770 RepID=UPI00101C8268|nr:hypothetical protein [Rothia halotolerans]
MTSIPADRPIEPTPEHRPQQPAIHIHNNVDANAHVWRVVGTVLAVGAFCSIAWGLGQAGLLELASALTTAFLFQFVALLLRNGIIVLPDSTSDDARIEDGKSAIRSIIGMVQAFIDRSSILRLALIAMAYGLAFIAARAAIQGMLGIFSNVFIAAGAGAAIAAVICAPTLFTGLFRALKVKRGERS